MTVAKAAERVRRVEALLAEVEAMPDPGPVVEALRALLDLYGEGLRAIVAGCGDDVATRLADDELVGFLFLLHDLHPLDTAARAGRAADRARIRLGGAVVEGVEVDGGVATVRLRRRSGCGSAAARATEVLTEAIRDAAPEVDRVVVEEVDPPPPVIPVEDLFRGRADTRTP